MQIILDVQHYILVDFTRVFGHATKLFHSLKHRLEPQEGDSDFLYEAQPNSQIEIKSNTDFCN